VVDVALLHHQYGPYHVARARALDRRLGGGVGFVQLAAVEALREWQIRGPGVEIVTLAAGTLEQLPERRLAGSMVDTLERMRPGAVVIAGYSHAAMQAAARWCRRNRAASILLLDSHHADRRRHWAKELAKRVFVSRYFDSAFTAGNASAAYARTLGFATSQIWRGYDVVDNAAFAEGAALARSRPSSLLRDLGLPEQVFLYVGRFSPEKNLHGLLDAMADYRRLAGEAAWGLLLVGSGPEAPALERRAAEMRGSVAVTGFRQVEELAEVYAAAGALILPSTSEPWGLVVNEAMACALPILASDRTGAASDLVFPGVNGYVFDPESRQDMVAAMLRLSSPQVDRQAMGIASERIIANYTPETWATALSDCIEVTRGRRRLGQ
jgi:1,2-diacylglycerol 3-alpha-glucosyltransferase